MRGRVLGLGVVLALVSAACGESDTGGASLPGAGTSTTAAESFRPSATSFAPATTASSPTSTAAASTTTTTEPSPLRVVETRTPQPTVAPALLRDGEVIQGAIALPEGSLLVSVLTDEFTLCSARIYRVDPRDGFRVFFATGFDPQLSPDGRAIAYISVEPPATTTHGVACIGVDLVVTDLLGQNGRRVEAGGDSGAMLLDMRWSPDGRSIAGSACYFQGECDGVAVISLDDARVVGVTVDPQLVVALNPLLGRENDRHLYPGAPRWLSDGSLVVLLTGDLGEQLEWRDVPQWYRVGRDGSVSSRSDAITDAALVAELVR